MMEPYKIDFGAMPWATPAAGVRCKVHAVGGRQLRLLELGREFVEADWCTKGHIGYVLEGQLEIRFAGSVVGLGPGDGLFIPAGEAHKARVVTGHALLILVEEVA